MYPKYVDYGSVIALTSAIKQVTDMPIEKKWAPEHWWRCTYYHLEYYRSLGHMDAWRPLYEQTSKCDQPTGYREGIISRSCWLLAQK